tara:strand:- start:3527 stop:3985 length:459 start_codon:yes stop_codon:yes gene_type:complete
VSGKIVEASSASTTPILGVVKALYSNVKNRPLTHNLPGTGNYVTATTTSAYVEVYIDPDIIFEVVADSAMSNLDIGQVGDIAANASGNPSTGKSRQEADGSSFVAATSANVETLPLICVGIGKTSESKIGTGWANDGTIEVLINNHVFRPKT